MNNYAPEGREQLRDGESAILKETLEDGKMRSQSITPSKSEPVECFTCFHIKHLQKRHSSV